MSQPSRLKTAAVSAFLGPALGVAGFYAGFFSALVIPLNEFFFRNPPQFGALVAIAVAIVGGLALRTTRQNYLTYIATTVATPAVIFGALSLLSRN